MERMGKTWRHTRARYTYLILDLSTYSLIVVLLYFLIAHSAIHPLFFNPLSVIPANAGIQENERAWVYANSRDGE
jgi:hypothetical protein